MIFPLAEVSFFVSLRILHIRHVYVCIYMCMSVCVCVSGVGFDLSFGALVFFANPNERVYASPYMTCLDPSYRVGFSSLFCPRPPFNPPPGTLLPRSRITTFLFTKGIVLDK